MFKHNIICNSLQRSSGTNNVPNYITRPEIVNVKNISIVSSTLPNTQWTVNSNNNIFSFNYSGTNYVVALTKGYYTTVTSLCAMLLNVLTNNDISPIRTGWNVVYGSVSGYIAISNSVDSFYINLPNTVPKMCSSLIGFMKPSQISSSFFTSDVTPLLAPIELYICSNTLSGLLPPTYINNSSGYSILEVSPLNVNVMQFNSTLYPVSDPISSAIVQQLPSNFDMYVQYVDPLNPNNMLTYDFNGQPWSVELRIHFDYKK